MRASNFCSPWPPHLNPVSNLCHFEQAVCCSALRHDVMWCSVLQYQWLSQRRRCFGNKTDHGPHFLSESQMKVEGVESAHGREHV